MGMSILYAPFFGMAHVYAKASAYEADGYSMPYRFALVFSALFYVLVGLLFLRKTLKHFFDEGVTSLVLLAVGIGTNLFYLQHMRLLCHTHLISRSSPYLCITLSILSKSELWKNRLPGVISRTDHAYSTNQYFSTPIFLALECIFLLLQVKNNLVSAPV